MVRAFQYLNEAVVNTINGLWKYKQIEIYKNGGRKAGKTQAELEEAINVSFLPYKIDILIWRYESNGANETFDEIAEIARDKGIPDRNIKYSRRHIVNPITGTTIRVMNYKSNQKKKVGKLGLKRVVNAKMVLNIIDEVSEFQNQRELQAIYEAISDAELLIKIESQNPFNSQHFWSRGFTAHLPQKRELLETEGQQFTTKEINELTLGIWHRSNHRVNHYLSEREHLSLQRIWDYDPNRARVSDLGMDGVEDGAIYTHIMNKLFPDTIPFDRQAELYMGGVDWGKETGHSTAYFGWTKQGYKGIATNDEFHYDPVNRTLYSSFKGEMNFRVLNDGEKALLMVQFYKDAFDYYGLNPRIDEIEIAVDYGNPTFIDLLNGVAEHLGYEDYLRFHDCTKDQIPVRVKRTLLMSGLGLLQINRNRCKSAFIEYSLASYSDNPTNSNYRVGSDHAQDAIEYMQKKMTTRVLKNLPQHLTLGDNLKDLYGLLTQTHERKRN